MRRMMWGVALGVALLAAGSASAQQRSDTARLVADLGCARCHGADGLAVDPASPNLAGQKYDYLLRQISVFRQSYIAGPDRVPVTTRAHPAMSAAARGMTPDQMKDVARHYSLLPCGMAKTASPPPAAAPAGAARCEVCHGGNRSNPWRDTPYLAGQPESYLYRTMADLVQALRQPDAPHDRYHRLAEFMFEGETDAALRQYARYYAQLSCKRD